MKHLVLWLIGIIVVLFVMIYAVLFTQTGNHILKPLLESQINKHLPIKVQLETFSLSPSFFQIDLKFQDKASLSMQGKYSLWTQKLDGSFSTDWKDSHHNLSTKGILQGSIGDFWLKTTLDFPVAGTRVQARLKKFDFYSMRLDSDLGYLILSPTGKKPFSGNIELGIPELKNLAPYIKLALNGEFDLEGKFEYKNDTLDFDLYSKSLGGDFKGYIKDKKLQTKFKELKAQNILALLGVSPVFEGLATGDLNYDFTLKKGELYTTFAQGRLARSKLGAILRKYTDIDLSQQFFDPAHLSASFYQGVVEASFALQNPQIHIHSERTQIDLGKKLIDSNIKLTLDSASINTTLSGDVSSPHINIKADNFIKTKIQKNADEVIKKYVPKDKQEKIKNFLNNALKKF